MSRILHLARAERTVMSSKKMMLIVVACLINGVFYTDAAPSIGYNEFTASKTVRNENRVLENDNEHETEDKENTAFGNFIQGIHNIDSAMEAMIDNYTDGVEHIGEENGLPDKDSAILDKRDRGVVVALEN